MEFERQRRTKGGKGFPDGYCFPVPSIQTPSLQVSARTELTGAGSESVRPAGLGRESCAPAPPRNCRQRALLDSAQSGALGPESGEVRTADGRTRDVWGR